ncbi:hypothetical protein FHT00_001799 [Sphingomonas insulae]|uniref:DUF3617 family protein n=1 Tax=Sphingomonas insulae TaxID=424800 RepID=A0ABP3T5Y3_9SPHN|nr:hypothetical protein [Sphingomonas insulae]NIJ29852.1 hypothetical protein [Sphingomonas insulae]
MVRGSVGGGAAAAVAMVLAAQAGPTTGQDIIVKAGPPRMEAGLWSFHAGAVSVDPVAGSHGHRGRGPQDWSLCIGDGNTPAILEQLIGARAVSDEGGLCSRMGLTITRDRVNGSRRCALAAQAEGDAGVVTGLVAETRMRAAIAATSLTADYTLRVGSPGYAAPKSRWRVSARRMGDCQRASAPAPVTAVAAPIAVAPPSATAARPERSEATADDALVDGPLPGTPGHPDVAEGAPATTPLRASVAETPGEPEDIVVIARKLRRIRLHYASSGKAFRWCHADISSGDPRLDRVGCAMVRACVREGEDTTDAVLGCVKRRIDTLDPVTGPLPKPVARRRD